MEVHNNFSPLAFRKKKYKATYEKWYAFGKNYAIPASANTLTPFQFTELNIPVFDPDTIEVEVINEETGEPKKTGVYVSFDVMPEHGGVLYVSPGKNSFSEALPQGTYRARFSIGDEVYISTPFCVIPGIETSSKYLLIEYWNDEKIAYPGGFITTGANNDFRYQMYVPATICKPKYEFEEELTKRAGYKFLELQTSTKVYAFTFVAPEFICDAMRLIRLSDYIRISHDGEYYNALNFEFDVDWQEQLYLAAVDCQFETDSIIQKLPSFNRRDKASFYNALLANIDTPIMFSPDTVGLYYKEYRETEPVVKGKLIRELSPIDLIDENTTIAVDLGTGEARKFNLYRMLQDYISKAHEDATDFLLHLRGGATFGEGITGSAASINAVGDAEVQGLNARVTKVKSLDSEDYVTVNKTAFTVNKQGDTALNALNARGVSRLQQDVYTGNDTGKITKEGQLQYLSAIIQQFLSSPTFVSGFLGEGFKIWVENGNWHIECDNLTVRQTMNIFELLIQKIRSVNGALVVSQSNGKLSEVKEVGEQYKLTTGEEFPTFQEGDLVRCQTFAGYQGAGLTFDFTQFAKFDYSGSSFDSSLVDVTPDSISFNLNDTGNSGFAFYKMQPSSETPIEIPSFILILEGAYPGMMAVATGLDSNDSPVESAGVLLKNGENVIPDITLSQGIHNFAITVVGDSGHGTGKVTVKQKRADGSAPSNNFVKFYWVEVKSVDGTSFFVDKSEFNGVVPAVGDEVVQMGNTKNPERQALIYITAQESGQPYIEILNGVKTKSLSGTNRTRLGDLSNIQDSAFPEGQQPSGSGLYCDNAFLRGIFLLRNGKSVEDEVNQAKQDAANAATEAERAQQTAQEAKDRLNKWADDGFISPTEKPALIDEGKRIQAEFLQIKNNADKYGVSVTEYTKAYEDYLNELRYHSAQQPEDIAVRPELAKTQTIYYDRRNGALNAIANAAKSYVDEADSKLKEYLDTEITAIPGKIELAVRSLKIADVNLLKGAYKEVKNAAYNMGYYFYDVPVIDGKEYTLSVCYTLGSDNTKIGVYSNGGTNLVANLQTNGDKVVESTKITMKGYKPGEGMYFFQFPNGTFGSKVHWAVLTDGNLGVTSWIPSASEKNVGLKNLCSFKRITDAKFTYASRYDDDGTFLIDAPVLHRETLVANKDMFDLTYNSNKRYYIFVDYSEPTTTIPSGMRSIFFRVIYTDGTTYEISVFNDRIENNFLLTEKPISKIVGSYGTGVNGYMRIGVYETNFPVSWSPAPEDQLYQSVKYTDTQILAVDGKISLSVTTELNKRVIGGANLILKSGTCVSGVDREERFDMSQYFRDLRGKKVTISFDYEYSNLELGRENRIGLEEPVLKDGTSKYYWVGTFKHFNSSSPKSEKGRFVNTITVPDDIVTSQNKGIYLIIQVGNGTNMKVCNPQIEIGDTATGWKPAPEDGVNSSIEYTKSQIDIVEREIELKVSSTTYENGIKRTETISKLLSNSEMYSSFTDVNFSNGRNNLNVYDNSGSGQVTLDVIDNSEAPNGTHKVLRVKSAGTATSPGAGGFYYGIQTDKNRIIIFRFTAKVPADKFLSFASNQAGTGYASEWLTSNHGTGKWEEYIHVVYCGGSGTFSSTGFFYINQGGAYEMLISYASAFLYNGDNAFVGKKTYETKITQLDQSISLKASQSDLSATTERVRQAEIKLDSTSVKLGVVEGTANSAKTAAGNAQNTANAANSLASTANNKAEAADGRVTATQNGLVETGINITSRKIVLKSDNVLFQNNAGQQTAALNANGKLTANAIEVGEVVAGGFAAQRITTGNLTVTDGAVIGGMTITGGVLTGKNINIQDGARIGNFTIVSGIFSAQNTPAGIQMTLSNNASTFDSSGVRVEHNSGGYALTTTGNGRVFLTGSNFWVQCNDVDFMGVKTWKAPGVFYACTILGSGAIGATWGNPDFHITRVVLNSTGRYTVYTSGGQVGNYFVMVQGYDPSLWLSTTVEPYSPGEFTYKVFDVNNGMKNASVIIYFCGMVS
ncbi:tail fiber protein [Bacteroides phage BF10P3]|nr:tail fiber protein [Bacteroides phage BF10P3]